MAKVERCVNKNSHKVLLGLLKVIPMLTALGYLLNTVLTYIGVDAYILSYLVGMSLFPWLFILLAAFVFRFCIYHRMFLYYILTIDCINIYDFYIGVPMSDLNLMKAHLVISGLFLFLILYLYVKCNKKTTK